MKGYKGFGRGLTCRGFKYEIGKTYECDEAKLCVSGFHFYEDPKQIADYYGGLPNCRYCEIEAGGEIIRGDGKCVCSKMSVVKEIPLQEFLLLVNKGEGNFGWCNDGDFNKGNGNKGCHNDGNYNKGDGLCGVFNTDAGCVIFNKYTPVKHTEFENTRGYRDLATCILNKRTPLAYELSEIKKLPNFDERVMTELIFGKENSNEKAKN